MKFPLKPPDIKETGCTRELSWILSQPPNAVVRDLTPASGIINVERRMLDRWIYKQLLHSSLDSLSHISDGKCRTHISDERRPRLAACHSLVESNWRKYRYKMLCKEDSRICVIINNGINPKYCVSVNFMFQNITETILIFILNRYKPNKELNDKFKWYLTALNPNRQMRVIYDRLSFPKCRSSKLRARIIHK